MAARKQLWHPDETRKKIQVSQLINRLSAHALSDKPLMNASQVNAARALINKCLPDLQSAAISSEIDSKPRLSKIRIVVVSPDGRETPYRSVQEVPPARLKPTRYKGVYLLHRLSLKFSDQISKIVCRDPNVGHVISALLLRAELMPARSGIDRVSKTMATWSPSPIPERAELDSCHLGKPSR